MTNSEIAVKKFCDGYNCCQAVLITYADKIGMDKEYAARLSSPFGAGMGGLREVCGAVTAMFMAAGALKGYSDDNNKKKEHYKLIQEMAEKFKEKNGTIICRDLLKNLSEVPNTPQDRNEKYYKIRPCARFVADAAQIIDEMILP